MVLTQKKMNPKKETLVAFFLAISVSAYVIETFIPQPLPFFRVGIANVPIMILLARGYFSVALWVGMGKVIFGGVLSGILFSPQILLSFCGTLSSVLVMMFAFRFSFGLSMVGVSVLGAFFSNLCKIMVAQILIFSQFEYLLVPLTFLSIISGVIVGVLSSVILGQLKKNKICLKNIL